MKLVLRIIVGWPFIISMLPFLLVKHVAGHIASALQEAADELWQGLGL